MSALLHVPQSCMCTHNAGETLNVAIDAGMNFPSVQVAAFLGSNRGNTTPAWTQLATAGANSSAFVADPLDRAHQNHSALLSQLSAHDLPWQQL
jgi:hypothetical protein